MKSRAPKKRRALVVLGMHRSGTSALTRVLGLLGATLPKNLMPATDSNPRGYFESQKLFELHDELLHDAGTSWFDLAGFPVDWVESPVAEGWIERLAAACLEEFGDSPFFVMKDPRMVRLLPIWSRVFDRLEVEPSYVLTVRNPLDVAASLKRAENTDELKGLLLWLQYFLAAEHQTRGSRRCFQSYEALLTDWRAVAADIAESLRIVFPRRSRRAEAEIDAFLTPTLQHQSTSPAEVSARHDVVDWVKEVYKWAHEAAAGSAGSTRSLDRIRVSFEAVEAACGPLIAKVELDRARSDRRAGQLETEVIDLRSTLTETQRDAEQLSADLDASREQLTARGNEVAEIRDRLVTREDEGDRLVELVKFVLEAALGQLDETATRELTVAYGGGVLAPLAETGLQLSQRAGEVEQLRGDVARLQQQVSSVAEVERIKHESAERSAALSRLSAEVGALRETTARDKTRIEQLKKELAAGILDLDREKLAGADLAKRLERSAAKAEDRSRELAEGKVVLMAQRVELDERKSKLGVLRSNLLGTEAELATARDAIAEQEQRFESQVAGLLQDLRRSAAEAEVQSREFAAAKAQLMKVGDDIAKEKQRLESRVAALEQDLQVSAAEAEVQSREIALEQAQLAAQETELEMKTRELGVVSGKLQRAQAELARASDDVADREFCVRQLRTRLDALPKAHRSRVLKSITGGS